MSEETVKLVVFVPADNGDQVRQAAGEAGAGQLGYYSHCSFSIKGTGRFIPQAGADPHDGEIDRLSEVEEDRVEMTCPRVKLQAVIKAVEQAHPYEEVPIDIYPLLDPSDHTTTE